MELFILLVILVALDVAALRWGFDSRDRIDSHEWERGSSGMTSRDHDQLWQQRDWLKLYDEKRERPRAA